MDVHSLEGGFDTPVLQAQTAFRAIMDALANPGTVQDLGSTPTPPAPLVSELATVALTLCDHDTPIWLDRELATDAVIGWLRFHAGAPFTTNAGQAAFAFAAGAAGLSLSTFGQGNDLYPDRSTTLVLAVASLDGGAELILTGPGIEKSITIAPIGLPGDFLEQWLENAAQFPRGIDLLLVAGQGVVGLPRTTRISRKDA